MSTPQEIGAVLFDLDGTLLDTAVDMAAALNAVLSEEGREPLPFAEVRPEVSHGSTGLLRLGFGQLEPATEQRLRERFLSLYAADLHSGTRLFEGMARVLAEIERRSIPWGVVTNKPGWLTEPLLDALEMTERAACVVSGDTLPERKPHPAPLHHAAALIGADPRECIYVGDAERDVQAGRAAGMRTIVAAYGYIPEREHPHRWGADASVEHPAELHEWLFGPTP